MLSIGNICYRIRMLTIGNTDSQTLSALGAAVRARRVAVGMGVGELAQRVGCSRFSVINLERGHKAVSVVVFVRVCLELGMPINQLLAQNSERSPQQHNESRRGERGAERERCAKGLLGPTQVDDTTDDGQQRGDDQDG